MLILKNQLFDNYLDLGKLIIGLGKIRVMFIQCLLDIIIIFLVGIYRRLHDEQHVIQLVVHIVLSTWHWEYLLIKDRGVQWL